MKVLILHNSHQQRGGEDVVVEEEAALLHGAGQEVIEYRRSNHEINALSLWSKSTLPVHAIWSGRAMRDVRALLRREKPHVAHFHNTFAMISPSLYYVCQEMGVPVVQTLHNYRLCCPRADFFRGGHVCEACLRKTVPWPGVVYGCYHHSRVQTASVATMLAVHRWLKTWQEQVNLYITLTEFSRQKLIQGGLPAAKIVVKPHFVHPDPGVREGPGEYVIFVGRFSPEKDLTTLLVAWKKLRGMPLKLVGDGPAEGEACRLIQESGAGDVEWLGRRPRGQVLALIKKAHLLVSPSASCETFGLVAVEAFACGVPVVASRLGAMAEIVEDGRTGLLFTPGDPDDLADKVRWAIDHPDAMERMGKNARELYEAKYTAEMNYHMLMNIYARVREVLP
jgi:glycosyltransferase involved in cell wall biosynthesis